MSRGRKLLIVGLVFAVGFGLAWPFRKSGDESSLEVVANRAAVNTEQSTQTADFQPIAPTQQPGLPAPHVTAKMASMGDVEVTSRKPAPTASFDLANHPALATSPVPQQVSPVTPAIPPSPPRQAENYVPSQLRKNRGNARPAYATADRDRVFDAHEQGDAEIRHVVQNSDTLEKLAKRYLGDEGRALEIFDLNRDILDNPHLLPIDAELRIPADGRKSID